MNQVFKAFRCPTCDKSFERSGNSLGQSHKREDLVRNIYSKSVYQLRETFFDKLRAFDIEFAEEKTLFNNFVVFDLESICVYDTSLFDAEATTWLGKHEPVTLNVTSNLFQEHISIHDPEPHLIVSTFVTILKIL